MYDSRRLSYYDPLYQAGPSVGVLPSATAAKEILNSKSGFTTFGIIAILFVVILCCLIFYYGIICYPLLCKSKKTYQFMNASSTIITRSMQSIDNFPVDQKH